MDQLGNHDAIDLARMQPCSFCSKAFVHFAVEKQKNQLVKDHMEDHVLPNVLAPIREAISLCLDKLAVRVTGAWDPNSKTARYSHKIA